MPNIVLWQISEDRTVANGDCMVKKIQPGKLPHDSAHYLLRSHESGHETQLRFHDGRKKQPRHMTGAAVESIIVGYFFGKAYCLGFVASAAGLAAGFAAAAHLGFQKGSAVPKSAGA